MNVFVSRSSYFYNYNDMVDEYGLFQLNRCVFFCFGSLLQQGGTREPEADSGRIFIMSWLLFVILIVTFYSGMLVAMIAIPQMEPPLDDFETMLEKDAQYDWGFLAGSQIERYLQETPEEFFQTIFRGGERFLASDLDQDSDLYERIKNEDLIYVDQLSYLQQLGYQQYLKTGKCSFAFSKQHLFYQHLAFAFPKDSPWIEMFNKEIRKMKWSGLMDAYKTVKLN